MLDKMKKDNQLCVYLQTNGYTSINQQFPLSLFFQYEWLQTWQNLTW